MRKDAFAEMREEFILARGLTHKQLQEALAAKTAPLVQEWREALSKLPAYCIDCHKEHLPSLKCAACKFCKGFLHAPMPEGIYFDFRGWRWTPPFICMGCGIEVCYTQWAFSRSCGSCDVRESLTRRLLYRQCFAGAHEKLPTWNVENYDIPEEHFVDPKTRMMHPVISPPRPPLQPGRRFRPIPRKPTRRQQ
jgi:hypothetical protein